jgi:hypothetical protein
MFIERVTKFFAVTAIIVKAETFFSNRRQMRRRIQRNYSIRNL